MATRSAASLLCLTLLASAPCSAETDLRSALALFESRSVFHDSPGGPDPLRGLLYSASEGRLTAIGELLYRGLSGQTAPPPPDGREAVPAAAALVELEGAVSRGGAGAAARSALLGVRFDGGAASAGESQAVDASDRGLSRGSAASDAVGAAGQAGVGAPAAAGAGDAARRRRELERRLEALGRGLEHDRLLCVAELLGERWTEDQLLKDESEGSPLKRALLRRAERSLDDIPFRRQRVYDAACGGYVGTVLELVDCGLMGRRAELEAARRRLPADERLAARHAALAVAETLRFHAAAGLESLGSETARLREDLASAPFSPELRERYAGRAADLAERLGRLLARLTELEKGLRAAPAGGNSGLLAALDSAREELEEAGLDVRLFLALPALAGAAAAEGRGLTARATGGGALLANGASRLWGGAWLGGYLADRKDLGRSAAALSDAAARIAAGDFSGARQAGALAAMTRAREPLGRVAEVHAYSGIVVHLAAWSAALAAAAPAAGFLLSGATEGCFAAARSAGGAAEAVRAAGLARAAAALRAAAFVPRASGLVLEHAALRLAALGAATEAAGSPAAALRARLAGSAAGLGAFSLVACGGASGAASAALYGAGAFRRGYLDGAGWAVGSRGPWWTPLVLFVGVPSAAWAGTPVAGAAEALGEKGLVGGALSIVRRVPGLGGLGSAGLEAWARGGGWRAAAGTALGTGDQLAKYAAVSRGAGAAAEALRYRLDGASGTEPEPRLRRARAAGEAHRALPYWLLLPAHPAARGAAASAADAGAEGWLQYLEAGRLGVLARPEAEGAELPLLRAPRSPVSLRLFEAGLGPGLPGSFVVTRELRLAAVRRELAGAGRGPLELYELSRRRVGRAGRLPLDGDVRDQARSLFERSIASRPDLALRVLEAPDGRLVGGFGTVRPSVRREVARVVFRRRSGMPGPQARAAERVLGPELRTERAVDKRAAALVSLRAGGREAEVSEAARSYIDVVLARQSLLGRSGGPDRGALLELLGRLEPGGDGARRALRESLLRRPSGREELAALEALLPLAQAEAAAAGEPVLRVSLPPGLEARARAAYRGLGRLGELQLAAEEAPRRDPGPRPRWARGGPVDRVLGRMGADMSRFADSSARAGEAARAAPGGPGSERLFLALRRRLDGLTRAYARDLLSACWRDPSLQPGDRWALFWRALPSLFLPRGSWVEVRLLDAACGRTPRELSWTL